MKRLEIYLIHKQKLSVKEAATKKATKVPLFISFDLNRWIRVLSSFDSNTFTFKLFNSCNLSASFTLSPTVRSIPSVLVSRSYFIELLPLFGISFGECIESRIFLMPHKFPLSLTITTAGLLMVILNMNLLWLLSP